MSTPSTDGHPETTGPPAIFYTSKSLHVIPSFQTTTTAPLGVGYLYPGTLYRLILILTPRLVIFATYAAAMRNIKKILLSSLFIFALPCFVSATHGGTATNEDAQANFEFVEGSGDTTIKAYRPGRERRANSFMQHPRQQHIFSKAYKLIRYSHPNTPARRIMGAVRAFMKSKPSPSDFWDMAKKSENNLLDYVHRLLEDADKKFMSSKFTEIRSAMDRIVSATATFRDNVKGALDAHHISFDTLTEELEDIFTIIGIAKLAAHHGIDKEVVLIYLLALEPPVHKLTVAIGDLNEQYPQILPALTFSVSVLLMPESWILRPFLSVFGFGPSGPAKGSAATWIQRHFWGGAVGTRS
ncbi:hypothetical protein V8E55_002462 [Tylopilus felleus]